MLVFETKQPLTLENCVTGTWGCKVGLSQKVLRWYVKAAQQRVGKRETSQRVDGGHACRAACERLEKLMRAGKIESPFVMS